LAADLWHALGAGIHTEGDTLDELKANIRDALECHFDEAEMPRTRLQRCSTAGRWCASHIKQLGNNVK
jgi:hypothetical protein